MLFVQIIAFLYGLEQIHARQSVLQIRQGSSFRLRHVHGLSNTFRTIFQDVPEYISSSQLQPSPIHYRILRTYKRSSFDSGYRNLSSFGEWEVEPITAPDTSDPDTVLELAKMTNNAYVKEDDKDWYDLGGHWSHEPFGFEPDADGFRGHIFVNDDNSTVILTIKGTTPEWIFKGGSPTSKKDKLNDNLLFSCCCARVNFSWKWSEVCGCYKGGSECYQDCVEDALIEDSLFYNIGTNLYNNVTYLYPNADIWITGHSLGGALASLLGVTFGVPVVAFESPGELLASRRLHLPIPPSTEHIVHFFNTADPVAMGTCNGAFSTCSLAGYAFETSCHLGQLAVWDTVGELGWSSGLGNHEIQVVIDKLLSKDGEWYRKKKKFVEGDLDEMAGDDEPVRQLPAPVPENDDCLSSECYSWDFV